MSQHTVPWSLSRVGRGVWQGSPTSGRGKRHLRRGTYGAYSGGGVLGTTTSNMSSRRTSSRRRVVTCQKRRVRDEEGKEGSFALDAGTTAGVVLASTVRVGARARVNGKGGSSTFLHGGVAICTMVRPETALSRDWVGDGSSPAHGKHRLHVAATFQLGIASPAASGGEGLRSGFATHAC